MPLLCTPLMYAAASLPVRTGSSEKDSKLRPPRGERCRHTVGASRTSAPRAFVSAARCSPTWRRRSRSHVAARETPQGNRAAGVPSVKRAPRAPLGPSVVLMEGIDRLGIAVVLQKSWPARRATCWGQYELRACHLGVPTWSSSVRLAARRRAWSLGPRRGRMLRPAMMALGEGVTVSTCVSGEPLKTA